MTTKHFLMFCAMISSAAAAELRITVYDTAHLTQTEKRGVYNRLSRILRRAGIETRIFDGDLGSLEASSITVSYPSSPAADQGAGCRARRDIALHFLKAPPSVPPTTLGISFARSREGLNPRIFADHVWDHSVAHGVDFASVLAYVAAHEIGHVLLRGAPHAPSGLMGAVWTHTDYSYMCTEFLQFDKRSAEAMRATLAGEGCGIDELSLAMHQER